tara:strand:+ start:1643 stop:2368 length:726 start_codon:yes stop_codon:yes gene_type:complete
MNALEKYAAKKKLTDKMLIKLLGEKPGLKGLLAKYVKGSFKGGVAGGAAGHGLGALFAKAKGTKGALTSDAAFSGGELGAHLGGVLGAVKGVKDWGKARKAYDKRKVMTAAGAAGVGGASLGALLASAGKKKQAAPKFSPAMDKSPALEGAQSKLPDKVQAGILKKKLKGKKKQASFWDGLKRMFGGNPYNPKTQPAQHAMAKGGNQSGEVMLPKPTKTTAAAGPDARTRKALKGHQISFR